MSALVKLKCCATILIGVLYLLNLAIGILCLKLTTQNHTTRERETNGILTYQTLALVTMRTDFFERIFSEIF